MLARAPERPGRWSSTLPRRYASASTWRMRLGPLAQVYQEALNQEQERREHVGVRSGPMRPQHQLRVQRVLRFR
jgi:hypothetical protein